MKISLKGLIGGIAAVLIGVAAVAGLAAPLTFGGSEPFGRSFYETGFDALLFRSETVYRGLALSKTPLILVGLIVVAQIVCGAAGIVCGVLSVFFPKLRKVSRALTIACVVLLAMYAAGGLY